ncbi:oxidoreductase [Raoultibacter phocaeensis]|uniref:oxidoreductase n=1 Tax=Raoultibacter phocaeensis TaxID=2479841 RepID=UPI00111A5324|nr:FAD-dependent oxidoreductase [Raoultibacter phocaeensis]
MRYRTLFEPVSIAEVELPNRFAMCAMGPMGLGDAEGGFTQRGVDYYVERAKGGTGLIITGVTHAANNVEVHEYPSTPSATINPPHFIRTAREMTERIHAYGSSIFLQLSAGFGRVFAEMAPGELPVSASPIQNRWFDVACRPLAVDEIRDIVRQCGQAARIAKDAGFDGVQIHAVHEGYLLDQFAISFFNQRTDEYGGTLENRLRFAREVCEEIKRECGSGFPVTLRYSPKSFIKDWREGALPGEAFEEKGRDVAEGVEAARLLASYGYDALDVDVGCYDAWWWNHPPMYQEKGLYRTYAKIVKEAVDVPVICAGRMDDPDRALAAVEDGTCDIVGLARPLLADPQYVNKLRADDVAGIRPCLSCHEGCLGRMIRYKNISCAVNPACARERYAQLVPAFEKKRIVVVGGGPAGMEVARVCTARGHDVVLYEARDHLGGNLVCGGVPDFKEDDRALVAWYVEQLKRLGTDVRLSTPMTAETLAKETCDHIVVATGALPKAFPLGDGVAVFGAEEVLLEKADPGSDVAVIGGGLVGCELALWLAKQGRRVTIVEALEDILALNGPLCPSNFEMLRLLLVQQGVDIVVQARATAFEAGELTVETPEGSRTVTATGVVECVGYTENDALYEACRYGKPAVHKIGDARTVANIMNALWDAYELGSSL